MSGGYGVDRWSTTDYQRSNKEDRNGHRRPAIGCRDHSGICDDCSVNYSPPSQLIFSVRIQLFEISAPIDDDACHRDVFTIGKANNRWSPIRFIGGRTMHRLFAAIAACLLMLSAFLSPACAHYLWVTVSAKSGEHGTTNIYFEGGPSPGDGQHLDPFVTGGKTWIRTVGQSESVRLKMADTKEANKRWLSASLTSAAPRSIDSYGKWGVYKYSDTDVLLHYYARHLDVNDHDDLHELARAEQLSLDIVPHDSGNTVQLKVLWKGKPAASRSIAIRGPSGFKETVKTDQKGNAQFRPKGDGRYTFRTNIEEAKSGTDNGKEYQLVRHHMTLIMKLPLSGP
jgi:uncharacterized GH25 family protein